MLLGRIASGHYKNESAEISSTSPPPRSCVSRSSTQASAQSPVAGMKFEVASVRLTHFSRPGRHRQSRRTGERRKAGARRRYILRLAIDHQRNRAESHYCQGLQNGHELGHGGRLDVAGPGCHSGADAGGQFERPASRNAEGAPGGTISPGRPHNSTSGTGVCTGNREGRSETKSPARSEPCRMRQLD